MQLYARVQDGVVRSVSPLPDGTTPADCFAPDLAAAMRPCGDEVKDGWSFANDSFQAPVATPLSRDALLAYARSVRWTKETGGVSVAGVEIATDDRSKTLLLGARMAAEKNESFTTPWSAADGSEHTLSASQIIAISDAVLAHVAEVFGVYSLVASEIGAGSVSTYAAVDAAFAATA